MIYYLIASILIAVTALFVSENARTENRSGVFYGMRREGFYSFRLGSSRIAFTE